MTLIDLLAALTLWAAVIVEILQDFDFDKCDFVCVYIEVNIV